MLPRVAFSGDYQLDSRLIHTAIRRQSSLSPVVTRIIEIRLADTLAVTLKFDLGAEQFS